MIRVSKKLTELGYVGRGKSKHRPRNDQSLYDGLYPFIQTGDVKETQLYISSYSQTYNDKGLSQSKLWNPGTLLITIAANIAETAILKIPACFPDSIVGFVPNKDTDVRFVKYYIDYIKRNMQSVSMGTTQDNLSLDKLSSFNYEVPDFQGQQKIASILSVYDDLIENNNKKIQVLEKIIQSIYKNWFVEFRFPEYKTKKFLEKNSVKIPENWEVCSLSDKFCIVLGGTPSRNKPEYWGGEIPWINSGKTNEIRVIKASEYISDKGLKKSSTKIMPPRTTLIAITGATLGQVSLTEFEFCGNQSIVGVWDEKNKYNEFIYLFIKNNIKKIINKSSGGAQQHINKDIVKETKIIIPETIIIEKFNKLVCPMFDQIKFLLEKNILLKEIKDTLLPKLISGELDVEGLDIKIRPEIL